jgi:tRNA (cmo5U34)-methyltransferase
MKSDNTTSHNAAVYDLGITKTIPYYDAIHHEILQFVKVYNPSPVSWLDTGCGTGNLGVKIYNKFNLKELVLADPSEEMLQIVKSKLEHPNIILINSDTNSLNLNNGRFDVITAVQSHHYLNKAERGKTAVKCFELLKENGLYITFENIRPVNSESVKIIKEYWKGFQISQGKTVEQAENHLDRFDKEYFPITIEEHLKLYTDAGFAVVDILWKSYMQAGFYCIKRTV